MQCTQQFVIRDDEHDKRIIYFDGPTATWMEKMRIVFLNWPSILDIPDVETMIVVKTG